ncbi:molecular chaperone DnaJ [Patescibacteria group bacterium]
MSDYYQTLGISKEATQEEIKRAYRKLAHQYHPDKKGGDEGKFKEINEAYQTLSDPQKKNQYDQFGRAGFDGSGFQGGQGFDPRQGFQGANFDFGDLGGFGDIFESMFGGTGARKSYEPQRGNDLEINLEVSFKEAVFGVTNKIKIEKQILCGHCGGNGAEPNTKLKTCPKCNGQGTIRNARRTLFGQFVQETVCNQCHGEGKIPEKPCKECKGKGQAKDEQSIEIKIPAGIENGTTLRLGGAGNAGEKGAQSGDLFVNIFVKADPLFKRIGKDIYSKLPITFSQAALGDTIKTKTVHGEVEIKIPASIQNNQKIRLRGKGVPVESGSKGDHYLEIIIVTPEKLSKEQKELFKKLKNTEEKPKIDQGFFEKFFS